MVTGSFSAGSIGLCAEFSKVACGDAAALAFRPANAAMTSEGLGAVALAASRDASRLLGVSIFSSIFSTNFSSDFCSLKVAAGVVASDFLRDWQRRRGLIRLFTPGFGDLALHLRGGGRQGGNLLWRYVFG